MGSVRRRENGGRGRLYVEEHRPERTRGEQLRGDGGAADLKKTQGQGHELLCDTGIPIRNGNPGNDRTTTTKVASVRKQLDTKNSKSNEGRQAKNGGVKGRDGSAEELDRQTGKEQITVECPPTYSSVSLSYIRTVSYSSALTSPPKFLLSASSRTACCKCVLASIGDREIQYV